MGTALKIGRTLTLADAQMEGALEELKSGIQNEINFGTSVPDRNTTGHVYFKLGATTADALTIYVKDKDGNWNGG